jgi:hypothetical protein
VAKAIDDAKKGALNLGVEMRAPVGNTDEVLDGVDLAE